MNDSVYASIKDAAQRTGVSQYCIRQLIASGDLATFRSGVKQYVNMPKLLDLLASKEAEYIS